MLRKIGNLATMCLLLVSTTGFAVSEHFCGSELISIKINKEADSCCDNDKCCHSDTAFYKMDMDFNYTLSVIDFEANQVIDFPKMTSFQQPDMISLERELSIIADFESPPPLERSAFLSSIQIYLL